MHTLPFFAPRDATLTMLTCAICWLSMHLCTLAYMSMHESCLLVFFLVCLLACLPSYFLAFLFILWLIVSPTICYTCHAYHAYLLYASFICFLHLFLPLHICWFLVFAFACTHIEQGHTKLVHGLLGASKKGEGASMWI